MMKTTMKDGYDDVDGDDEDDDYDDDDDDDIYAVAFCHSHNNLLILLNNKCNYVPGCCLDWCLAASCGLTLHHGKRGKRGVEGAANYEINLDTKPGRHCGLKLQKPRHCVESCVLSPESLHAVRPKNLHFSAKCFCLDFLVNLIYWKISA